MKLNIEYEKAIDFEHIETMQEAREKLSVLTNILNKVIAIRHQQKAEILLKCSEYRDMKAHKLSWENKIVALLTASNHAKSIVEMVSLWMEADEAYAQVKNKQNQVMEDLMALKKMIEVTPR